MEQLDQAIEKNFFGPLAGPERTHDPNEPKRPLPWAPMVVLMTLTALLFSVFVACIGQSLADPERRPPPQNYYPGADVVGLVVTLVLCAMLAWTYISVSLTDPGRVPKEWPWDPKQMDPRPDFEDKLSSDLKVPLNGRLRGFERKMDGRTRFCKKCNMYKPDRAHHCKKLGRCVLEMDHWCPWVRNTIGYRNRKYFFLCVTYGWATLLAYCIVLGPYLPASAKLRDTLDFFVVFCWILAAIECLLLLVLWSFHIFLTVHSFTTIEFREKHLAKANKTVRSGDRLSDLYKDSLYHLGLWDAVTHLLGPNPLLWLIPTRYGMPSDNNAGVFFRVRPDHPLIRLAYQSVNRKATEESQEKQIIVIT